MYIELEQTLTITDMTLSAIFSAAHSTAKAGDSSISYRVRFAQALKAAYAAAKAESYYITKKGTAYASREDFFARITEKVAKNIVSQKASEKQTKWGQSIALKNIDILLNYSEDENFSCVSQALREACLALPTYITNPVFWIEAVEMGGKVKHELDLLVYVSNKMPELKTKLKIKFKHL